jgi:hypothetical protein
MAAAFSLGAVVGEAFVEEGSVGSCRPRKRPSTHGYAGSGGG